MSLIRASTRAFMGLPKSMRKILMVSRIAFRTSKKMTIVSRTFLTGSRASLPGTWITKDCQFAIYLSCRTEAFVASYGDPQVQPPLPSSINLQPPPFDLEWRTASCTPNSRLLHRQQLGQLLQNVRLRFDPVGYCPILHDQDALFQVDPRVDPYV